jgi:hypothetical protein
MVLAANGAVRIAGLLKLVMIRLFTAIDDINEDRTNGVKLFGRFLIRLSDSLFSAPQSDLEKNQNAVRKGLARNAQIRGVFGSPP